MYLPSGETAMAVANPPPFSRRNSRPVDASDILTTAPAEVKIVRPSGA